MLDTLVIADRDVDQAQAVMLAVRNAGFDNPIFYARTAAALVARLSTPEQKAPRPSAILIDLNLLRECGSELMHWLLAPGEPPIEITALLSSDKDRMLLEQCGFRQIGCVVRPLRPLDVLRLPGVRARSKTPPSGTPRLLWPARPEHRARPVAPPILPQQAP